MQNVYTVISQTVPRKSMSLLLSLPPPLPPSPLERAPQRCHVTHTAHRTAHASTNGPGAAVAPAAVNRHDYDDAAAVAAVADAAAAKHWALTASRTHVTLLVHTITAVQYYANSTHAWPGVCLLRAHQPGPSQPEQRSTVYARACSRAPDYSTSTCLCVCVGVNNRP